MDKSDFHFKKEFGQNFIFDKNYLTSLVSKLSLSSDVNVLEIGSGMGSLSTILASNFRRVVSYEIDKTLTEHLENVSKDYSNLTFVFKDILREDMSVIDELFDGEDYVLVANLPYYITSEIIFRFLLHSRKLSSICVMVQKEVADRLSSPPSCKEYGIPSVILGTFASCKIVQYVPRTIFTPQPNVDSAMIRIDIDRHKFDIRDVDAFCDFVSRCFNMKRKTLVNNLLKGGYDKSKIITALEELNISSTARPETLSPKDFVSLFEVLGEK